MKRSLFARGLAATVALGSIAATMLVTAPTANAAPAQIIAATGSDTTEDFMEQYLVNPDPGGAGDNGVYNIQARYFGGDTEEVPGDANCATRTYYTGTAPVGPPNPVVAPNGSSAGRNALRDTLTVPGSTGCYDLARSSSTPRAVSPTGDNATFEYYAFAMDALAWVSPSLNAPAQLTRGQIQSIYNCTFTDWSQVGGAPGPIQRYIPQPGSGTTDFWVNQYIGFDPTAFSGPNCPAVNTSLQENDATGIPVADYQKAILGYSAGKWLFQKNLSINPTLDLTNGTQVGNQIPEATFTANTTNGSTTLSTRLPSQLPLHQRERGRHRDRHRHPGQHHHRVDLGQRPDAPRCRTRPPSRAARRCSCARWPTPPCGGSPPASAAGSPTR